MDACIYIAIVLFLLKILEEAIMRIKIKRTYIVLFLLIVFIVF